MTINLKIEIIKIFTLEFSLSSDKKLNKDEANEQATDSQSTDGEPASAGK